MGISPPRMRSVRRIPAAGAAGTCAASGGRRDTAQGSASTRKLAPCRGAERMQRGLFVLDAQMRMLLLIAVCVCVLARA